MFRLFESGHFTQALLYILDQKTHKTRQKNNSEESVFGIILIYRYIF